MRVGGGVPAPSRTASPLLLLKQAGGEVKEGAEEGAGTRRYAAKLLPDGLSDAGAVELAIGAAMAGGELPEGFELLSETPTAEQRLPPPPPPRQEREEKSVEATRTLSDAELKALRAEREAERQRLEEERLEQRRAQMQEEEAMAGNLVEEVEEEGEAEEEADEAEEEVEVEEFE